MDEKMDRHDHVRQAACAHRCLRLLHLLRVDVLVRVLRCDQPFPVEMGTVCALGRRQRTAVERREERGFDSEWAWFEEVSS